MCHATHELYSDRFSQRRGNSMSMRSCQRRGVGFLPRFSVLMWCWLARDGLFIVVYLRKCWKFFFSMCFPNRWFVCIMRTCMWMCVYLMQSSCVIFPPRSESMCRRLLATRGQFLSQQFGYVVFFVHHSKHFEWFGVCSARAQISRTHGFHVYVWCG